VRWKMVKVLLKKSIEDAGVIVEVSKSDMSEPNVINHEGVTFAKSPVPETLKLCGSCRSMQVGAPKNPLAGGWHCTVDSKEIPYSGTCRNGGWDPAVVVYRRVKRLTVTVAPTVPDAGESPRDSIVREATAPTSDGPDDLSEPDMSPDQEMTVVVARRPPRLPGSAYVAASLFFTASVMATIWVLQWASR